jgi:hypothetical protein
VPKWKGHQGYYSDHFGFMIFITDNEKEADIIVGKLNNEVKSINKEMGYGYKLLGA